LVAKASFGRPHHVDVGIAAAAVRSAAHADEAAVLVALVAQMVTVGASLGPGHAIARAKDRASIVLDQHRLALEHDQELVLAIVPVALRRPGAGLQHDMADAEVGEASGGCEPAVPAAGEFVVEWRRVAG